MGNEVHSAVQCSRGGDLLSRVRQETSDPFWMSTSWLALFTVRPFTSPKTKSPKQRPGRLCDIHLRLLTKLEDVTLLLSQASLNATHALVSASAP